ncbi:GH21634 [Drosophila grimshawi]|uniref:GH21634 n=1 Tax=Drosophila grimshawi TaxID=7222 RepID=B4J5F2_DROGR|nr:GH21634 [Drosophila grimshawi]
MQSVKLQAETEQTICLEQSAETMPMPMPGQQPRRLGRLPYSPATGSNGPYLVATLKDSISIGINMHININIGRQRMSATASRQTADM